MTGEPFHPSTVKKMILDCMGEGGTVSIPNDGHAAEQMKARNVSPVDVVNVLRGGVPHEGELVSDSYRYRVTTPVFAVVIAFRSAKHIVVVTAWRFQKKK